MSEYREFRWKIGAYSAETMPLDRLLEYLDELTKMLGEGSDLHLIRVESSSTQPVFKVSPEAAPRIHARGLAVRTGSAPREAQASYRRINKMLREDKTRADLLEDGAEIIPFPGIEEEPKRAISGIQQQGSIDGKLNSVGGRREWVPIQLETPEGIMTGIYARRRVAKELGPLLFEPVRLLGRGRWSRSEVGDWHLDYFAVTGFDQLGKETLPDVVRSLRAVKANWPLDPISELDAIRNEANEQD